MIADGSMGSGSAHMCEPYPAELGLEHACGVVNIDRAELTDLMAHASRQGYEMAIHAIGDAAVDDVAAAFAHSGAAGRLEHAQLLPADALDEPDGALRRLVGCGIELSVQPAHIIDDWAAVSRVWPGLEGRTYAFADMGPCFSWDRMRRWRPWTRGWPCRRPWGAGRRMARCGRRISA